MHKRLFLILLMFGITLSGFGFAQSFKPLKNTDKLENLLKENTSQIKTIFSKFTQIKSMAMLQDKVHSEGLFYFQQPNKIRIEYTKPFQYIIIMSGNNMMIKDGNHTTKMNMRNNNAMQSVNHVLMDCMTGTVFTNTDFKATTAQSTTQYRITLKPQSSDIKEMLSEIDVYLNKSNLKVTKLVMHQQNGDQTNMTFTDTKNNIPIADALFKVH